MKLYYLEIEETRTTRAYALAESEEAAKQLGYGIDLDDYYVEPELDIKTVKEIQKANRSAVHEAALTEYIEHDLGLVDVQLRHALVIVGLEDGELPEALERYRSENPPEVDSATLPLPGFDDVPVPQKKP